MAGQVTVACKLPHGLTLRVFEMVETQEPVMGGGYRTLKIARELPQRATLNGWSHAQNAAPAHQISDGYAITHGVDKDLWDVWLAQNKDNEIVKNNLVFAAEKPMNVQAEAKEKKSIKSGLERLDPQKLPKGITKSEMAAV